MNEAQKAQELKQMAAVIDAYWSAAENPLSYEFAVLKIYLENDFGIKNPTEEQHRIILRLLPRDVIGRIISWGFSDGEVSEEVDRFIKGNQSEIRAALGL